MAKYKNLNEMEEYVDDAKIICKSESWYIDLQK